MQSQKPWIVIHPHLLWMVAKSESPVERWFIPLFIGFHRPRCCRIFLDFFFHPHVGFHLSIMLGLALWNYSLSTPMTESTRLQTHRCPGKSRSFLNRKASLRMEFLTVAMENVLLMNDLPILTFEKIWFSIAMLAFLRIYLVAHPSW